MFDKRGSWKYLLVILAALFLLPACGGEPTEAGRRFLDGFFHPADESEVKSVDTNGNGSVVLNGGKPPRSKAKSVYTNGNGSPVLNGGKPPSFELEGQTLISCIENYHYGRGKGTPEGGKIGLIDEDGKRYGPWKTETRVGQGGVPNAYWTASPNVVLPPGTYKVTDTDPATWSQNKGSKGFGMTTISGTPATK